jgi:pyruvate dehydrogenase E2 component (dihydrolipoamide acetyltransferase)
VAIEIKMPALSQTTEEVRFIRWLVREGDSVKKGDPLCEVETDKTTMEVESFESGTVLELYAKPEQEISAGTVIALLGKAGEKIPAVPSNESGSASRAGSSNEIWSSNETGSSNGTETSKTTGSSKWIRATHIVQNLARKKNIDLRSVQGTGPRGLITKKDLESHAKKNVRPFAAKEKGSAQAAHEEAKKLFPKDDSIKRKRTFSLKKAPPQIAPSPKGEQPEIAPQKAVQPKEMQPKESPPSEVFPSRTEIPLSGHQLMVSKNLQKSMAEAPHYYLKTTVWMDSLLKHREKTKLPDGSKLSFYSFFIRAAARALAEYPRMNGYFRDERIKLFEEINIGFAVFSGEELYVPVVREADKKPLNEIDREVKQLVSRTKDGQLEPPDLVGATFTVTNLGVFSVDEFYAVINPPQAGILAFGQAKKRIYVDAENGIHIRSACSVSGSFDHRIVNGAQGAAFLEKCKIFLELEEEIS